MSRAVGAGAESLAASYLIQRGFRILETNYTCRGGEIDLVCDDRGTLVFVEVRARQSARYGTPAETVTRLKQQRILHAARNYLLRKRIEDRACRFDVVAIEGDQISYIPDAFSE